jgi:hypothetical protein
VQLQEQPPRHRLLEGTLLLIVTSAGATNGAGQFNSILSIPNNPALEGFAIGHQSAVLLGVDLVLSNVAFGIVTSCEVTG